MTTIGERIKQVRKNSGLSQTEFATKLEVTQGFIGHIENGRNQPTVDLLMRIAIIFNCDGHWLLSGDKKNIVSEPRTNYSALSELEEALLRVIKEGDATKLAAVKAVLKLADPGRDK